MWTKNPSTSARTSILVQLAAATALLASGVACSPGTLPGSPSPILFGGGGGRYNGTVTYRRVGTSGFTITETAQALGLSIVLRQGNQVTGRFESAESSGSLQGTLNGDLANGSFAATILISSVARSGGGATTMCEGQGEVMAMLSGRSLTWTSGVMTYDNKCPGLTVSSQAQAVATSPIPGQSSDRANVVLIILGGSNITRGTCAGGVAGYPHTVAMMETSGTSVTFDSRFRVEERRNFGPLTSEDIDMPFTELPGGGRREYSGCSVTPGTYQAFFSGIDANGNRVRVATPIATFLP